MRNKFLFAAIGMGMFAAAGLRAQTVPTTINYQGRLTDNTPSQAPVNGVVNMAFEIWDAPSGGTRQWAEPASGSTFVLVTNGVFSVPLGASAGASSVPIPASVFSGGTARYLQLLVNGEALTPRQTIAATGYANQAQNAALAASATTATTATTAADATNLGGVAASGYLLTGATAYNSDRLGGIPMLGWQRNLSLTTCPANQFYNAIAVNGPASCAAPAGLVETDPKVGTLTPGRVPYWLAAGTLTNGTLFDSGTKIGINTAAPIAPLQIAGANPVSAGSAATGTNPRSVFIQGRYAYVVNYTSNSLQVFDISNPAVIPAAVGTATTGTNPFSVFVQGRYAYVVNYNSNSLQVFDISNPVLPAAIGTVTTGSNPTAIYVQGRYAYVASSFVLQVFDIANPAAIPAAIGSAATGSGSASVYLQGRYAYVTNSISNSLQVFDISNPAAIPAAVGTATTGSAPSRVHVEGRYAYVVNNSSGNLQIFDISNPAAIPAAIGTAATGSTPSSVYVQQRYAYVFSIGAGLQVFDISNPAAIPAAVGTAVTGANPVSIQVQGRYAYGVNFASNSLQAFDLGGAYIQQLEAGGIETGTLTVNSNAQFNNDVQIKGGLNIGNGGINSAGTISATSFAGTLIGSATTENDPKVGTLTTGRVPRWNATSLSDGTMYDTGTNIGINTAAPIAPLQVAGANPVSLGAGAATGADPKSVFVQGRYAYVVNQGADTLQVFDVSNPAAIPAAVGSVSAGVDPSAVYVQGRYAYVVNQASSSLQVFDISNPAAIPAAVGIVATGSSPFAIYVQGRYAYVVTLGGSTLQVFDVSNPAAIPAAVGTVATGTNPFSVVVQGRYAYVVNIGLNTLQAFDISNPALPALVGSVSTAASPRSVSVQGRYAYVVTYFGSLQVFDISNPSAIPSVVGSGVTGTNPNALQVHGRYAYVVTHGSSLLQVFDISDPAAIPAALGTATTGGFTNALHVQGRYAYVVNMTSNRLQAFDLGGAYLQQLEAGGIETGTLATRSNAQIGNDLQVKGGLGVGNGGISSSGSITTAGRMKLGVYVTNCTPATAPYDCVCSTPADTAVGGGGALTTGNLRESRPTPSASNAWRVTCATTAGAASVCTSAHTVCLSHGN